MTSEFLRFGDNIENSFSVRLMEQTMISITIGINDEAGILRTEVERTI